MARITTAAGLLAAGALLLAACGQGGNEVAVQVEPSMTAVPTGTDSAAQTFDGIPNVVGTADSDLTTPWGLDFLPNGVGVVTERTTGRILLITPPSQNGSSSASVTDLGRIKTGIDSKGDGGLLGVAVSPDFSANPSLYFYETTKKDNRVVRMPLSDAGLGQPTVIIKGIPAGRTDNGGQLRFGPDGDLYVGTGDAGRPQLAKSPTSLAGKILRVAPDGKPASGNPGKGPVWASGFRDVLGLAFDGNGQLWATDAGVQQDELNHVLPGANAGWPKVEGNSGGKSLTRPAITWAPQRATPGGLAFVGGYLWLTGVQGQNLWRIKVDDGQAGDTTPYFGGSKGAASRYGALRSIALSPDGQLWLGTSNTDGAKHGKAGKATDRILLIQP
ncbi:MAG: PQQ-dependent sugar dehydrogenase [Nocardioidaceae bacterium]|nr:PQQ-dependent sugar dehydrogenase [Nocardioidaceae bacterium]MCL2612599.1 PQQ-dependent sugar dehydrogenase [Nocardioidaceae bacterium]